MVNIRPNFKGRRPFKKGKKKKKAADDDSDSDSDVFSDYSDASEDEEIDENASPTSRENPRKMLKKTWSVNSFNLSSHSAGVVYLDGSDSETDDDSSDYDEFASDSDNDIFEEVKSPKSKKKKKGKSPKKKRTKTPSSQFKEEFKMKNKLPGIISEGEEDDEVEDTSHTNYSDDDSPMAYNTPFAFKNRPPSLTQLMAGNDRIDTGYSSDSALVRKRMQMIQQEQKKISAEKKKKRGKKKTSGKKKDKKKSKKTIHVLETSRRSLGEDTALSTLSADSFDDTRHADETDNETKSGRKKKKKKHKKKRSKDGKSKKKRAVISFLVDGNDEDCENFDKRMQEIEQFEASLIEERKAMQKERETMAFERESMEIRMEEETQRCDELQLRIRELEQLVHSQEISNAGNAVESKDEKNGSKLDFMREKRDYHIQLTEKDQEIEDLKHELIDLKSMQGSAEIDGGLHNMADGGKSRERLQGELLQTVAKLSEKEEQFNYQSKELDQARQELAALKAGKETTELKNLLIAADLDKKKLRAEMEAEKQEYATKLKDKDETVTFLMNELARLKIQQSTTSRRKSFR